MYVSRQCFKEVIEQGIRERPAMAVFVFMVMFFHVLGIRTYILFSKSNYNTWFLIEVIVGVCILKLSSAIVREPPPKLIILWLVGEAAVVNISDVQYSLRK